ncbi:MAG TPA: hypothetical protein VMM16_11825 [Verrucomicrobiae bacterium]|nr:hypothetical protein [Verrucomicrobiae bacterium]
MKSISAMLVVLLVIAGLGATAQGQSAQKPANSSSVQPPPNGPFPDWGGIWTPNFAVPGPSGGDMPSLTPQAVAQLKLMEAADARNEEPATAAANCLPPGMPTIMFMPYDLEFLFTPGKVTIIQEAYMQVRHVYMDGRSHPAKVDPTFNGHSIGHWEGSTLVIDTVGLGHKTPIGYNRLSHGPNLHIVEHIFLTDPNTMEIDMELIDPDMLTKPWHTVHTFTRHREWDQLEYICEENNRNQIDETGQVSPGLRK